MTNVSEIKSGNFLHCPSAAHCSGCQYLDLPYDQQSTLKIDQLRELFQRANIPVPETIAFYSAGGGALRDRLDFSFENGRLGLYHKDKREILDLAQCPQLSPALQSWYEEFRAVRLPVTKGSVRLRIGPAGQKGVWLDLANVDIKALLEEQEILHFLQQRAFVELGQKRKVPVWNGERFQLKDPELHPWFVTWVGEESLPLFCQVASFTQPGMKANKLICNLIESWLAKFPAPRLIEFGSGIGNLTLPALAQASRVVACEIDQLSLEGLTRTLEELPPRWASLKSRLEIHRGDFQNKLHGDFSGFDGVLVNPPRSGLKKFLNPLLELAPEKRPPFFIYMSCYPESMATDVARLQEAGYFIHELAIVDQFPQTTHYEVLGLLQRKEF